MLQALAYLAIASLANCKIIDPPPPPYPFPIPKEYLGDYAHFLHVGIGLHGSGLKKLLSPFLAHPPYYSPPPIAIPIPAYNPAPYPPSYKTASGGPIRWIINLFRNLAGKPPPPPPPPGVPYPVAYPYPVPHPIVIPKPVPVEKPYYVSIPKPVKVPVPQIYPVEVPRPVPVKVPEPVIVEEPVPVPVAPPVHPVKAIVENVPHEVIPNNILHNLLLGIAAKDIGPGGFVHGIIPNGLPINGLGLAFGPANVGPVVFPPPPGIATSKLLPTGIVINPVPAATAVSATDLHAPPGVLPSITPKNRNVNSSTLLQKYSENGGYKY